jgi:hypothetical protein
MVLFKPMAADLAPTMAMTIQKICLGEGIPEAAMKAPVKAKGRAKTECENLIIRK